MNAERSRIVHIGLDACDVEIMTKLAESGTCPNIGRLMAQGRLVPSLAPMGTFVGSSWMTISTGCRPENHGFWNWIEIDTESYQFRQTTPRSVKFEPFWQQLSDAGLRVAAIDIPHMDLPTSFNGIALKEWGCHDRHDGVASLPSSLVEEINDQFGEHPVGCSDSGLGYDQFAPCDYIFRAGEHRTFEEDRELLTALKKGLDRKVSATIKILKDGPWDYFGVVFGEGHCAGHQFFHYHDSSHPRHDPVRVKSLGDPIVDIYAGLDRAVGSIIENVSPDSVIWLQLNHGMINHFGGHHLLGEVLRRLDVALSGHLKPGLLTRIGSKVISIVPSDWRIRLDGITAWSARQWASRKPPVWLGQAVVDSGQRFYQIPGNASVGAIRFNLAGRESSGYLEKSEIEEMIEYLTIELGRLVDIDSGKRVVRSVIPATHDVVEGIRCDLPDLYVEWEQSILPERVWSPTVGTIASKYEKWRTGEHVPHGVSVIKFPGITSGMKLATLSLEDTAPTIGAILGVPMSNVDGGVRWDIANSEPKNLPRVNQGGSLIGELSGKLRDLEIQVSRLTDASVLNEQVAMHHGRELAVWKTTAMLRLEPVSSRPKISVITPTFNRPDKLRRAINSVVSQRHENWEMLIVDDGSSTARKVVQSFEDERLRLFETSNHGPCHARNLALDHLNGEIVAYLDDDNVLDPGWLHAVAWAFRNLPDIEVVYGARIIDDESRVFGRHFNGRPILQFEPFDRRRLRQNNFADMGVIAHRSTMANRFDERLIECGDWDFFLSITEESDPFELPAIALLYDTHGMDRLSGVHQSDIELVRSKWAVEANQLMV